MTVRIWNASTGQEMDKLEGHNKRVTSAAFSPDGQFVVSGSWDNTVRIWNRSTDRADSSWFKEATKAHWQLMHTIKYFTFTVTDGFSADGRSVVLRDKVGTAICINLATALQLQENAGFSGTVSCSQQSSFCVRDVSGRKLQGGKTASVSVMKNGVWFSPTNTKSFFWLPPEFRCGQQFLTKHSILLLGSGISSVIQF
ncbi:WD40-repeat-containing domain protein [Zopfochytrium polystomum]|nr:WD40-repeat-containing domain protein [Zopfochytrium polystomum]